MPLGTPKNLGFPRVPGPDFRVWAPSPTLLLGHFLGGFGDPKNYGIPGPPRTPRVKKNGPLQALFGTLFGLP